MEATNNRTQATETLQISTETADTVNVSAEGEKIGQIKIRRVYGDMFCVSMYVDGKLVDCENGITESQKDKIQNLFDNGKLFASTQPPQSPESPQAVECTADSDYRVCSHCGKHFHEGYFLGDEYACSEECAVALYGGDRELFEADLEAEEEAGTTECYWSVW